MIYLNINPNYRTRIDTIHDEIKTMPDDPLTKVFENMDFVIDALIQINDKRYKQNDKNITQLCGTYDVDKNNITNKNSLKKELIAPFDYIKKNFIVPKNPTNGK